MLMRLLAAALLAVAPGATGGDDDTIVMRDGTTRSGKVQAAEAAGCTLAVGRKTETIAWPSISTVQYGGAKDFDGARQLLAEGKLPEGIAGLEKLAADKKMRAAVRQEVLFELARAYRSKGDDDKSLETWRDLAKSHPNGRYLVSGGAWLVSALIARNDPGGALRAVDELTSDARGANADAAQVAALDLLRGRALEGQKKFPDAQSAYERVAAVKEMPADYAAAAQLGVARALQGAGKKDDAVKRYRELLAKRPPPLVAAGAWNGIGDAYLDGAVAKKDVDALEEGLLAYLHVVAVDAPAPAEPPEELERALVGSLRCTQALADLENNKERKAALVERAQKRQDELKRLFPKAK
jgi:tetratricopeptide (TPR) repeat protein